MERFSSLTPIALNEAPMNDDDEDGKEDPSDATTDAISALDNGDVKLAVQFLRANPVLTRIEVEMLADMLDPECDPGPFRPYRLVLTRRKAGSPSPDPLDKVEIAAERVAAVERALQNPASKGALKNAIADAASELGVSDATIRAAWHRRNDLPHRRFYKRIKKPPN